MSAPREVVVREMRREDGASVAALSGLLGYEADARDVERRFAAVAALGKAQVFVAIAADGDVAGAGRDPGGDVVGNVVGWIHVYAVALIESDAYVEIGGLVVAEAARRRGVGRALVAAAERWAGEQRYGAVRVRSNVLRTDARRFYESLRYRHVKAQNVFHKQL